MGEYYNWVNVEKKEYLCPACFDYGNKLHETMYRENELLRALRELLAAEWKGCRILFLGDECSAPDGIATELFQLFLRHTEEIGYSGALFDTVCESYRNVSCLFKAAEKLVREEIEIYLDEENTKVFSHVNEYGIDVKDPYRGLFQREGKTFQYTLNHTKKTGYSLLKTKIYYENGTESEYSDPLPLLLGYGRCAYPGPWLGDIVGVADMLPPDYQLISEIHLTWDNERTGIVI